jgi:hypothetical protein
LVRGDTAYAIEKPRSLPGNGAGKTDRLRRRLPRGGIRRLNHKEFCVPARRGAANAQNRPTGRFTVEGMEEPGAPRDI